MHCVSSGLMVWVPYQFDLVRIQNFRFFFAPSLLFSSSSRFSCSRFLSARSRLVSRGDGGDSGCFRGRPPGSGDLDTGTGDFPSLVAPPICPSFGLLGGTLGFETPPILPSTPRAFGKEFPLVSRAGSGELECGELLSSLVGFKICLLSLGLS